MSVPMSLLTLLDEGPRYGLQLKNEFEVRTGSMWPLNVGQVYTTLARLERDGLVEQLDTTDGERQNRYRITDDGRRALDHWFRHPLPEETPSRDELVLKIVLAAGRSDVDPADVIQSERRAALQLLQEYTKLKAGPASTDELGWTLLLDSFLFKIESRVRWLDAAESRIARHRAAGLQEVAIDARTREPATMTEPLSVDEEVWS